MTLYRKRLTSCLFAMLALLAQAAVAQTYPSKPVRFVVGFRARRPERHTRPHRGSEAVGGPRRAGAGGQPPGADSMIGTQMAARATPDGYTIAMISASATIHRACTTTFHTTW
jgi:tripartite-type tricarboxylate transporter receptor subunit TctC